MEALMRKAIAVFLASLLLFPVGSYAVESKVNDGPMGVIRSGGRVS